MITKTSFICEFCLCEYDSKEDAQKCEAKGFPEPAPWFPLGEKIYAWGEDGPFEVLVKDEFSIIIGNKYGSYNSPHEWLIRTNSDTAELSHNIEYGSSYFPLSALNPLQGYDALRYDNKIESVILWRQQLARFGMKEEDAEYYIKSNIDRIVGKNEKV